MRTKVKVSGPMPDLDSLRDHALRHLARFPSTEVGLTRVLERLIQRWAFKGAIDEDAHNSKRIEARTVARQVARSLVEEGYVDDMLFATARAHRLARSGRSHIAVVAHLLEKGVQTELAQAVVLELGQEIAAAIAYARRRDLGPFRATVVPEVDLRATRLRDLGALARAGFPRDIAERVLQMERQTADTLSDDLIHKS